MPPAARVTDMHTCPMVTGVVPHVGGPILPPCAATVLIGMLPAARVTDMALCVGPPDIIVKGSPTVLIGALLAARMGDMTAHGGVITLGCPTVIIGEAGGGPPSAPIPAVSALLVFGLMAGEPDIAFKFPVDGCYARAHFMVQRMQNMGLKPGKVWTFSRDPANDPLWVDTPNHPDGKVEWGYHVAPTIPVENEDGTMQDMVVDPSMFDHPVTIEEWKDAQHDHPYVKQTVPGEPPIPSRGGSGYWPSSDPPEGADENAKETMEEYKRYEGTRGP